jgi:opacity protein-like surface antigen
MKKIAIATVLAIMAASASAVEVGVVGGSDIVTGNHDRATYGLTVGQHFGDFSVTAEALREDKYNTDKFSLVGGYDVTKLGTATITAKAGATYLDQSAIVQHHDRYVALAGVGVTVPVTSKVGLTVDYRYQFKTEDANKAYSGNTVLVGAKYSF